MVGIFVFPLFPYSVWERTVSKLCFEMILGEHKYIEAELESENKLSPKRFILSNAYFFFFITIKEI
jgi:hypothetical protein